MKRPAPFLLFCLIAFSPLALAQERTGSVEISPFGGAYFGGKLYAGSNTLFSRDVEVDTSPVYGLRIGGNFNRVFGLEASFSRAKSDIKSPDSGLFSSSNKLGELEAQNYELSGVFNLARGKVIPYITLGLGATYIKASVPGVPSASDTRFSGIFGIGMKAFFTPQAGFRLDARGRATKIKEDCGRYYNDCDSYRWDGDDNRWYTSAEVTGGLTFAF